MLKNHGNGEARMKFMEKHEINAKLRTKMVDWMIEVMSTYKCQEQTYFCALNILDRYFELSDKQLLVKDLHEIGVTAIWMATKYEEIYPIRLKVMFDKIGH